MTFLLRYPFRSRKPIRGLDDPVAFEVEGYRAEVKSYPPFVVLTIRGFPTEAEAKSFAPRVWTALQWLLINADVSTSSTPTLQAVPEPAADPEAVGRNLGATFGNPEFFGAVHGLVDGDTPVVFDESLKYRFITGGDVTVTVSTPIGVLLPLLVEGFSKAPGTLLSDEWFKLASDLFSTLAVEQTGQAKLTTLAMILEVLAEPRDKHPEALALLDLWEVQLKARLIEVAADTDAVADLESLQKELTFRRQASIRSSVRSSVLAICAQLGLDQATAIAKAAVNVYDKRSTLMHNGYLPEPDLGEAVTLGKNTVQVILRAYVDACGT